MKLSARNVLQGKVTASITIGAVKELKLKVGDRASAIVKASDVIVGKE
jgi:molybdopterin-binding protein